MKVIQCFVSLLIIIGFMEMSCADDGTNMVAMKRPFCNAFTGCGRKRDPSYAGSAAPATSNNGLRGPLPLYRDLLMRLAAARNALPGTLGTAELRLGQRLGGLEQLMPRDEQQQQQEQPPLPRVLLY